MYSLLLSIALRSPYSCQRYAQKIVYDFSRKLDSDCSRHGPCLVDDLTVQSTDVFGKEANKKQFHFLCGSCSILPFSLSPDFPIGHCSDRGSNARVSFQEISVHMQKNHVWYKSDGLYALRSPSLTCCSSMLRKWNPPSLPYRKTS